MCIFTLSYAWFVLFHMTTSEGGRVRVVLRFCARGDITMDDGRWKMEVFKLVSAAVRF
jgi:hypothetical protein